LNRETKKARRKNLKPTAIFLALALILPVSINALRTNIDILGAGGERLAAFAAAVNMPGAGLSILMDEVRAELGGPGEAPPQTPPVPVIPAEPPAAEQQPYQLDAREEEERPPTFGQAVESMRPLVRPRIPIQYQAQLMRENFAGREGGQVFRHGAGLIRNDTSLSNEYIQNVLQMPHSLTFSADGAPQVLIYHTHATEAFERHDSDIYDIRNTHRSNDNNINIVSVGAVMAQVLEDNGISVIHNSTQHDFPSHNRAYERSAATVNHYLEQYPSIVLVLDVHRDAIEREGRMIVKPVAEINGETTAQVMMLVGSDNGNLNMPNWRENLRFAAAFQDAMESAYPQLTRPAWLRHRRYNQHLSTGAVLIEIGSHANTLEEAVLSGQLVAQVLADFILEHTA